MKNCWEKCEDPRKGPLIQAVVFLLPLACCFVWLALGLLSICYEPLFGKHGNENARKTESKGRKPQDVDRLCKCGLLKCKKFLGGRKIGKI